MAMPTFSPEAIRQVHDAASKAFPCQHEATARLVTDLLRQAAEWPPGTREYIAAQTQISFLEERRASAFPRNSVDRLDALVAAILAARRAGNVNREFALRGVYHQEEPEALPSRYDPEDPHGHPAP